MIVQQKQNNTTKNKTTKNMITQDSIKTTQDNTMGINCRPRWPPLAATHDTY